MTTPDGKYRHLGYFATEVGGYPVTHMIHVRHIYTVCTLQRRVSIHTHPSL